MSANNTPRITRSSASNSTDFEALDLNSTRTDTHPRVIRFSNVTKVVTSSLSEDRRRGSSPRIDLDSSPRSSSPIIKSERSSSGYLPDDDSVMELGESSSSFVPSSSSHRSSSPVQNDDDVEILDSEPRQSLSYEEEDRFPQDTYMMAQIPKRQREPDSDGEYVSRQHTYEPNNEVVSSSSDSELDPESDVELEQVVNLKVNGPDENPQVFKSHKFADKPSLDLSRPEPKESPERPVQRPRPLSPGLINPSVGTMPVNKEAFSNPIRQSSESAAPIENKSDPDPSSARSSKNVRPRPLSSFMSLFPENRARMNRELVEGTHPRSDGLLPTSVFTNLQIQPRQIQPIDPSNLFNIGNPSSLAAESSALPIGFRRRRDSSDEHTSLFDSPENDLDSFGHFAPASSSSDFSDHRNVSFSPKGSENPSLAAESDSVSARSIILRPRGALRDAPNPERFIPRQLLLKNKNSSMSRDRDDFNSSATENRSSSLHLQRESALVLPRISVSLSSERGENKQVNELNSPDSPPSIDFVREDRTPSINQMFNSRFSKTNFRVAPISRPRPKPPVPRLFIVLLVAAFVVSQIWSEVFSTSE